MDEALKAELHFLIAKFIRGSFPEVSEAFSRECERQGLLPKQIFSNNPTFESLDNKGLAGIPDDQLLKLVKLVGPKIDYPSLLFCTSPPPKPYTIADALLHRLDQPIPALEGIAASHRVIGHFNDIFCLALDATNSILVTGSDDSTVKVWKIPEMTLVKTLSTHKNVITDVVFHPTNGFFASCSFDHTICVYNTDNFSLETVIKLPNDIHSIRFSPDGQYVAVAIEKHGTYIYNFIEMLDEKPPFMKIQTTASASASWLSFSPGSELLAISSDPKTIVVVLIREKRFVLLDKHEFCPDYVFFSQRSPNMILSMSSKGRSCYLWEGKDGVFDETKSFVVKGQVHAKMKPVRCVFNADETRIVAISKIGLCVWDVVSGDLITNQTNSPFLENCSCLATNPVFPNVAFVGCTNGRCSLWDIERGTLIRAIQDTTEASISEAIWTMDGASIYASDNKGGVTVFTYPRGPFQTLHPLEPQNINQKYVFKTGRLGTPVTVDTSREIDAAMVEKWIDAGVSEMRVRNGTYICKAISYSRPSSRNVSDASVPESPVPVFSSGDQNDYSAVDLSPTGSESENNVENYAEAETAEFEPEPEPQFVPEYDPEPVPEPQFIPERAILQEESSGSEEGPVLMSDSNDEDAPSSPTPELIVPDPINVSPGSWHFMSIPESHTYWPQVGEEIVYIVHGHRDSAPFCKFDKYPPPSQVTHKRLPPFAYAFVTDIMFDPNGIVVVLSFHEPFERVANVLLPMPDSPPFLVEKRLFRSSLKHLNKIKVSDLVKVPFVEDDQVIMYDAIVTEIDDLWKQNPYNALKIAFVNSPDTAHVCPWEVVSNTQTTPQQRLMASFNSTCFDDLSAHINSGLFVNILSIQNEEILSRLSLGTFFPLDIATVLERLKNGWYRTVASALSDGSFIKQTYTAIGEPYATEVIAFGDAFNFIVSKAAHKHGIRYTAPGSMATRTRGRANQTSSSDFSDSQG